MAASSLMVPLGTPAHDFELRLPLRAPARPPSAADDRAAPLRVVPGPSPARVKR